MAVVKAVVFSVFQMHGFIQFGFGTQDFAFAVGNAQLAVRAF